MSTADQPSALALITSTRDFLDSEQRIVDFILANPDSAPHDQRAAICGKLHLRGVGIAFLQATGLYQLPRLSILASP